ncbi:AbrB/MazE/SpoVT family DNA-binding domain-containing protein [Candidatus Micrarchaeota archaeon]|nr:AbrB/MazE/SpoVT family DNA-binding domain-containing protein [Candidatus Micrarchaeota archaeon]
MYVGVSKVTSKGQVTIPQELREDEGIHEGSEVIFFKTQKGLMMVTEKELNSMFDVFSKKAGQMGLTREILQKEVKQLRKKN